MENFYLSQSGLGYGERIYVGEYTPPMVVVARNEHNANPPAEKQVYRRAGRKKLTADQIMARDEKEQERRTTRNEEREAARKDRANLQAYQKQQKAERSAELARKKHHREQIQRGFNKNAAVLKPQLAEPSTPAAPRVLPPGLLPVTGAPIMEGFTAVRIDAKTIIHVRNGRDLEEAKRYYKLKHNINH